MSYTTADLPRLRRQRWGLRIAFALPMGGTVAGNVLYAPDDLTGQIISAWAPLALLVAIEAVIRTPAGTGRTQRAATWLASAAVAGIAAWVSYWHLAAVAGEHGQNPTAAHLLPISVDGLAVILSIRMLVISGIIRGIEAAPTASALKVAVDRTGIAHTPARPTGQPARRAVPPLPAAPDDPGIDAIAHLGTLHAVADAEADTASDDDAEVQDPDPLLPVARALADDLGTVPGRPALLQEIRKQGHKCGTDRAEKILIVLRAERGQAAA